MVFSDLFFLFVFIPAFALVYLICTLLDRKLLGKEHFLDNYALVAFSLIFYAWGEPVYVFLMIGTVVVNYIFGRLLVRDGKSSKAVLVLALIFNLGVLCTFKYLGLLASTLTSIGLPVKDPGIALPIGISFYTFQSISYIIDVYRQECSAQKKFSNLLLYISMFPQLIAGPIVRYDTIAREISERKASVDDFAEGVFRFVLGLGKKVILANQLSVVADTFLAGNTAGLSCAGAWTGLLAFSLQIYFDFSGYSDMAIGIGRCLGFHFKENFNNPYCCNTITDFWRRWHISLGSFFRDYLYIPLGGNRRHQPLNILIVWFLTGLWHGASWNFVLWGLYFGIIVMLEKFTIIKVEKKIPPFVLHIYSLILVLLGWGIFYFDDMEAMGGFFKALFGGSSAVADITVSSAWTSNFWLWIMALACCLPLRKYSSALIGRFRHSDGWRLALKLAFVLAVMAFSVSLLVGATNNPFLYTRF